VQDIWKLHRHTQISSFVDVVTDVTLQAEASTMREISRRIIGPALLGAWTVSSAFAQSPPPTPDPAKAEGRSAQSQKDQPQPVEQQDTVHPRNSKEDVEAIGNRKVGKGPNFYSLEKEIALGRQLAQEVERSARLVDDPVVTEYVNRVGQNLVRNSDARVPFTIKVIDSDEVNAFALPGGFFYVNSGLILRAQEESELAGVMVHEISHVTAHHGTGRTRPGGRSCNSPGFPCFCWVLLD
jgi:Peptidase family M48